MLHAAVSDSLSVERLGLFVWRQRLGVDSCSGVQQRERLLSPIVILPLSLFSTPQHLPGNRLIITAPRNGGKLCDPKAMSEMDACNTQSCNVVVDCVLSAWTSWESCSNSCSGVQQRSRSVEVYPKNSGKSCAGALKELRVGVCIRRTAARAARAL